MNDPKINRIIGYIVLFIGFGFVIAGTVCGDILKIIFYVIAALLIAGSFVWMIMKVRCPHCGALLHLKLYSIARCPHCGKNTDTDE